MVKNFQKMNNKADVIAIVGATASGKTAYSIELAQEIDGEIISADSRLVYKDFDIATAKPTIEECCGIKHHLIDIVEPTHDYSAGLYKKDALNAIHDITSRGKTPIIVGGTGLYIDILLKNYTLPQVEPNWDFRKRLADIETNELYDLLLKKDENAASIIDSNDKKKIIRALEILEQTGKNLEQNRGIDEPLFNVKWIGKNFERKVLYERINRRVDEMAQNGLVQETKQLLAKYGRIPNLVNTIGYKEILGYIDGNYSLEDALELLKKNTRHYAKRQLTWFRRNQEIEWDVYPEISKK